jgi:DNA replication protein DnaC
MTSEIAGEKLTDLALAFKLPTVAAELVHRLQQAEQDAALPVLLDVFEQERDDRRHRRVERLRRASKLPPGKTFDSFEEQRLSVPLARKLRELARGDFLDHAVNVLAFGLPGTGKTHSACALGHALVEAGHSVLFTPTYRLVQQLLAAKRDLELPKALKRLDTYELIILDDIGYVQQDAEQIEVLFTLMAERYERRSMLITSNLVFSQWDRIFRDPMTTAAAIDRLVHHSVILEFDVESYRTKKPEDERAPKAESAKKEADNRALEAHEPGRADRQN